MSICEIFIVRSLVEYALIYYYCYRDDTVEGYYESLDKYGKFQEDCRKKGDPERYKDLKEMMDNYFDTRKEQKEKYDMICDEIVSPLLQIDPFKNL